MTMSSRSASESAALVWLPRVLVAVVVGATIGTLVGCGGADEPESSGPLAMQTWSTAGESSSGSASGTGSGTASATSTSTGTTSTTPSGASATGTSGTTTSAPTTTADAGSAAAEDASTACVQPTDEGNSAGVGKFCTTSSDCGTDLLCSAAFGAPAGATFCSLICSTDADCGGAGATCFPAMGTKACVTAACAPLASTLF